MSNYSEESQRLAQKLAEKVSKKLERTGRKVIVDDTGRYVVGPRDAERKLVSRNGRTITITVKGDGTVVKKRAGRPAKKFRRSSD